MQICRAYLSLFPHLSFPDVSAMRASRASLLLHLAGGTHDLQSGKFDKLFGVARAAR